MNFQEVAENLNPQSYQALKTAIELGKWPSGIAHNEQQKVICLDALIAYEQKNLPADKQTGYMPDACKTKADIISTVNEL